MFMNIAFCYNVKHGKPSKDLSKQKDLEFDSPFVINSIKKAIKKLGHSVLMIEADENAYAKLKRNKSKIDLVFNVAEGKWGDARESQIPMLCEILKIPYTHSSPTTHAISLDKQYTKLILQSCGISVPQAVIVSGKNFKLPKLSFPVIVKPNAEGSSKGVLDKNVVDNKTDLVKRIKEISENFTKEVLVEEYIDGREFTVSVLGNNPPKVLPIVEQRFDFLPKGMHKIASFELKWQYEDSLDNLSDAYFCPPKLTKSQLENIEETSIKIYRILKCLDCSRIDYRMTKSGKLYFIEVNTLPGINPDLNSISYMPLAARTAGISFDELIASILNSAKERYKL